MTIIEFLLSKMEKIIQDGDVDETVDEEGHLPVAKHNDEDWKMGGTVRILKRADGKFLRWTNSDGRIDTLKKSNEIFPKQKKSAKLFHILKTGDGFCCLK